jgi:hypothetical protein
MPAGTLEGRASECSRCCKMSDGSWISRGDVSVSVRSAAAPVPGKKPQTAAAALPFVECRPSVDFLCSLRRFFKRRAWVSSAALSSITATLRPHCASPSAATQPATDAPTTITWYSRDAVVPLARSRAQRLAPYSIGSSAGKPPAHSRRRDAVMPSPLCQPGALLVKEGRPRSGIAPRSSPMFPSRRCARRRPNDDSDSTGLANLQPGWI